MRARMPSSTAVLLLEVFILTSACASQAPLAQAPIAQEQAPDKKERAELVVAFSGTEPELNPLKAYQADEAQIFTALFEGLFTYHPFSLEPVPALAESWTLSEDKRTWTFKLRESARYWNGDPVLASHFRDSWLSMIDPAADAPYSSLFDFIEGAKDFRLGKTRDPRKVAISTQGERTLVVTLASPAAYFPRVLCHHSFAPLHPQMLGKKDWSDGAILSNGPYYIVDRTKDSLSLVRNELYWDAKSVKIPKLSIRFGDQPEAAAALYDAGRAQWLAGDVDLDALKDKRGVSVNAMFATHYYFVRSDAAPWNDRRVRRALALALPWQDIRKEHLLPAPTLVFPIPGYPKLDGITASDAGEAKKLLAEAGYPEGKGVPELVIRITPSQDAGRIADLMAKAWKTELGIGVKVEVVPFDGYYQSLKKSDYVVGSSTWIGDFADPYTFLQMWRSDSNLNDAKYRDDEYETLVERSLTEEGETRYKTLSEAEKLLLEGGVVLPISYTPAVNVIDTDEIDGWYANPLDIHPFKYLEYAAFKPLPGVALLRWGTAARLPVLPHRKF
jgi:oligopeptide transport system substrate-binding protein